jgi:hypothetical protein
LDELEVNRRSPAELANQRRPLPAVLKSNCVGDPDVSFVQSVAQIDSLMVSAVKIENE